MYMCVCAFVFVNTPTHPHEYKEDLTSKQGDGGQECITHRLNKRRNGKQLSLLAVRRPSAHYITIRSPPRQCPFDVTRSCDATRDAPGAKEESDYQRYSLTSLPFSLIHLHCSFFSFSFNEAVALSNAPPSPYPPSPGWWMDSCNRPVPLGGRGTAGRWFMAGGRARVWHSAGHCEGTGHSDLDERGWGFGCGCGHVTVNAWCFISFIY